MGLRSDAGVRCLVLLASVCTWAASAQAQSPQASPEAAEQIAADGAPVGPAVMDGFPFYSTPPAPVQKMPSAPIAIATNTILAEANTVISEQQMVLSDVAEVGDPFKFTVASGSYFHRLHAAEGDRFCLERKPLETFLPPADEKGEIFPSLCLTDKDGDGKYEVARLLPYRRDSVEARDVAIKPVALVPAPDVSDPRARTINAQRRLRISAVTPASVSFVVEDAVMHSDQPEKVAWHKVGDSTSIFLEPGAEGQVAGLTLKIGGRPGKWTVAVEQQFLPWVSVDDQGTGLQIGAVNLKPKAL